MIICFSAFIAFLFVFLVIFFSILIVIFGLIDMCLKQYLTVSHVDFIPYSSVHPTPQHIFNLYVDNNETFYDADLTVNHEYVNQFLFHIKEIISSNDEDVLKYVMSWIAHKVQRPDKKIETCLLLISPE
jgi:hypothetical protein